MNFPLLTSEDIEVKVKTITKTGALLLLYKTARVDAKILDETVGPLNWCCDYEEIKGNLFCRVGVRESADQDFVYKSDCGIESGQDDGNEKKAEASDAFKRACSRWGIGRELYDSSVQIWADVATVERNNKWYLQDPFARYVVTSIEYNEQTRVITALEICNAKSNVCVFSWRRPSEGALGRKMVKTWGGNNESTDPPVDNETTPKAAPKTVAQAGTTERIPLAQLISDIGGMVKTMMAKDGGAGAYKDIVARIAGSASFRCNTATEEQYDIVKGIYDALAEAGYGN